jgi:broad specificity phosphatase PhoE
MPGTVLVVRHAESTWNAEHRWAGQADPPLSGIGREQARRLGLALVDAPVRPERVVTSDLRRAEETGRIVAAVLGLAPPTCDIRVRERRAAWSGCTSDEIDWLHPGLLDRWRAGQLRDLPGASEPWAAFAGRALAGLSACASRPGTTLVVTHAGVFRVVEAVCGVPHRRIANGEGVRLRRVGGGLRAVPAPADGGV